MNTLFFIITLSAEVLTTTALAMSIANPQLRIWPPSLQHAEGQFIMLTIFTVSGAGVILLGVLDWNRFIVPLCVRVGIGLPLWLAGNALSTWAVSTLGIAQTSGKESALVQCGPYRFSRNPQYIGFVWALVGWTLMTNSALVLIVSLAGILPLLLVPFAEEPWLLERHGSAYAEYKRTVPRFIAFKK